MCDDNPGKQAHIHTVMRKTCWILQETAAALSVGGCQRPSLHWRTDPGWEAEQAGQLCGGHEAALTGDSCRETAGHPGWSQAPSAPSHQQPEGSCCGRLPLPTYQSHRLRDSFVPWAIKLCISLLGGSGGNRRPESGEGQQHQQPVPTQQGQSTSAIIRVSTLLTFTFTFIHADCCMLVWCVFSCNFTFWLLLPFLYCNQ